MTTSRQIQQLVRPLVKERDDLIYHDRSLLIVPFGSAVRGINFSTGIRKEDYRPHFLSLPLFMGSSGHLLGPYGDIIRRPGTMTWSQKNPGKSIPENFTEEDIHRIRNDNWCTDAEDYPQAFREAIVNDLLPQVERLQTLEEIEKFWFEHTNDGTTAKVEISVTFRNFAYGNFDAAKADHRWCENRFAWADFRQEKPELSSRLMALGNEVSLDEKRETLQWLHDREEMVVHAHGLEAHWQPTPFPAEVNGLV